MEFRSSFITLLLSSGHVKTDLFIRCFLGNQLLDDLPLVKDQNPVSQRENLLQLQTDQKNPHIDIPHGQDLLVDIFNGPHIKPPGGLAYQEEGGLAAELPGKNHLLLITPREISRPYIHHRWTNVKLFYQIGGITVHGPKIEVDAPHIGFSIVVTDGDVFAHRHGEYQPEALPVRWNVGDTPADQLLGVHSRNIIPQVKNLSSLQFPKSHNRLGKLALAVSINSGDAHHLSRFYLQGKAIDGLSLQVKPGEVVGIAGVDGNGQSELAETIMGLRKLEGGKIFHLGDDIAGMNTKELIGRSISYVPADRQRFGLVLPMSVSENIAIGYHDRKPNVRGINLDFRAMDSYAADLVEQFDIRPPVVDVRAGNLSGGNQQKVILARELSRKPTFLLVSQPTRGLDVGAIEYIHKQILAMRDIDVGILLISLELEEIFSLADRILVLYEGKIVKELIPEETTDKQVGFYMTGGKEQGNEA